MNKVVNVTKVSGVEEKEKEKQMPDAKREKQTGRMEEARNKRVKSMAEEWVNWCDRTRNSLSHFASSIKLMQVR